MLSTMGRICILVSWNTNPVLESSQLHVLYDKSVFSSISFSTCVKK